jgi:hypothetical protein
MSDQPQAPPPPFRFSRESRIRIDREGYFWHEGERVEHDKLARALASWIAVDPESDRYVLKNALDWCFITVDDAPLVVRSVVVRELGGALALALSDGTEEPLDVATLRVDADDVPYCDVKNGALPARFSRSAAFALLERAEIGEGGGYTLVIPSGARHAIRRVGRGEGAPKRAPARPDP